MEMGQWVMGHSQWPIDPWWNNCAVACNFKYTTYSNTLQRTLFLADIKKLLTHSVRPIIIAGGLILIYDFLLSGPRGLSSTTMPRPLLVPCIGWNDVMAMGHGSWVTKDDPFPSLITPHTIRFLTISCKILMSVFEYQHSHDSVATPLRYGGFL